MPQMLGRSRSQLTEGPYECGERTSLLMLERATIPLSISPLFRVVLKLSPHSALSSAVPIAPQYTEDNRHAVERTELGT